MDNLPIVKKMGQGLRTPRSTGSRCATRVGPYPVFLYRARAGALSSSNLYFRVSCQISKMELEKTRACPIATRDTGDGARAFGFGVRAVAGRRAARETHPGEPGCTAKPVTSIYINNTQLKHRVD